MDLIVPTSKAPTSKEGEEKRREGAKTMYGRQKPSRRHWSEVGHGAFNIALPGVAIWCYATAFGPGA